ncbi:RluA family pseudouridine synthase [Candidatus Dependentiae bacterium]|nr:RluA family pseudouridine synthase [Candidatus Dependentiae bacterium]
MIKNNDRVSIICQQSEQVGLRLDKFLFALFPDYSRSYFQNLIDMQKIFVNHKLAKKASYTINLHDQIDINFVHTQEFDLTPRKVDFTIVDEQPDFLIINKPAGLVVHNSTNNKEEDSLVHGLLYEFQDFNQFDETERPGIVHRLDRDTSGLLIIAKNQPAQIAFSKMFKQREVHKTYLAVVHSHPDLKGSIDYPIGRHAIKRHKMSHLGINSKPALTFYNTLAYYKQSSLVAVNIVTGRTHQIRVHFSAIGHGLLGDELYGRTHKLINRQALHAWKLSFTYKEKEFSYLCQPPEDFTNLIHNLHNEKEKGG